MVISQDVEIMHSEMLNLVDDATFDSLVLTDDDTASCISPFQDVARQLLHLRATADSAFSHAEVN